MHNVLLIGNSYDILQTAVRIGIGMWSSWQNCWRLPAIAGREFLSLIVSG